MSYFTKHPHVFQPIKVGKVVLKNRIMSPPMLSCLATPDGKVTSEIIAFARAMAKTGAGLVVIGDSAIDLDRSLDHVAALNLGSDMVVPGLTHVVEEIHRYGAKASIELNHAGALAFPLLLNGKKPISPSRLPDYIHPVYQETEVEIMDRAMMDRVIANYVAAVGRCVRAGFDMVMIHGAHGWLLGQFLSPSFNQRTDEYGGSPENRMRFPLEVLKAIHDTYGGSIAVDLRISGSSRLPETIKDLDFSDVLEFLKKAEECIDIVNFSSAFIPFLPSLEYMIQPYFLPHKVNAAFAEKAKQVLKIPVTAIGSITTVAEAEELIAQGKADVVGMGRAGLADSYAFVKAYRGEDEKTRPCMRCVYCGGRAEPPFFRAIRCAVNPRVGREIEYPFIPQAAVKKNVMIVGGGPAGMQAAQTAVERGHKVTLYEKADRLGGMLFTASSLPFKDDMRRYAEWMVKETMTCGAKVVLNTEVTPELVRREMPDAVMIAIGAVPAKPPIPGIGGKNVVWAGDVDERKVQTGNRVIVAGAGLTGAESALALAEEGKQVILIDMIDESCFAMDASALCRLSLNLRCRRPGISMHFGSTITEITEKGLSFIDEAGQVHAVDGDTVVNALGVAVEKDKVEALASVVPETYLIGDCSDGIKNIMNAIQSAFSYALEI